MLLVLLVGKYITFFSVLVSGLWVWKNARGRRALQLLAISFWLLSLFFLKAILWKVTIFPLYGIVLGVQSLLSGTFIAMFLALYPIESILPHWLNGKKLFYYLIPFLSVVIIYVVSRWRGVEFRSFTSLEELKMYIREFHVWIRLVFFAVSLGYALLIFIIPYKATRLMYLPAWVKGYGFASLGITVVYIWVLLTGSKLSIVGYMGYIIIFCWLTAYRVSFYRKRILKKRIMKEKPLFKE